MIHDPPNSSLLAIRFCGLFGMFYSLQYLSMGDTTALLFVGPFVTGIAGHLILGEAYSHREAIAARESLLLHVFAFSRLIVFVGP